jgi:hypothetical protein
VLSADDLECEVPLGDPRSLRAPDAGQRDAAAELLDAYLERANTSARLPQLERIYPGARGVPVPAVVMTLLVTQALGVRGARS